MCCVVPCCAMSMSLCLYVSISIYVYAKCIYTSKRNNIHHNEPNNSYHNNIPRGCVINVQQICST